MPFSRLQYAPEDLAAMQSAFEGASSELGLIADSTTPRERLAEISCDIAKAKEWLDEAHLQQQAVAVYRRERG